MSILSLRKVTLAGLPSDRDTVLSGLQTLGCLHLIPLRPRPAAGPDREPPAPAEEAYEALRWMMDVARKRRQVRDDRELAFDRVVTRALDHRQRFREAEDRRAFLIQRIEALSPWGNFRLPEDGAALGGYRLWFYQVPLGKLRELVSIPHPYREVHRDNRFSYRVVIAREEPDPALLPVPRTHAGSLSLAGLEAELERTEMQLEDLRVEHWALSRWIYLVSRNLARAEDRMALHRARQGIWEREGICLVQGWVAHRDLPRVQAFADSHRLALSEEDPAPGETPPTLLANPPPLDSGEDLVTFYQTPNYYDWDPSPVIFFSFALFFAMILADAGYAAVLSLILGRYWRRLAVTAAGRRFRTLAVYVLSSSLLYGVLVGSYFGITPPADSFAATLKVLNLEDFGSMMKLSIGIGCLHLILANVVAALQNRRSAPKVRHLAWAGMACGGYLVYLGQEGGWMASLGYLFLGLGAVLILGFSGERRVTDLKSGLLRLFDGLTGLTGVTKMFGDVLSYLRLFALGLASASLAVTFNGLADHVREALPGPGLLLALLVLAFGHLINLGLAIVSGFVHGLRLNVIEFFNWGLSEEGYPFRAFAKKEIES